MATLPRRWRDAELGADGVNGAVRYPATGLLHYLERFDAGGTGIFVVVFLVFDGIALSLAQDEISCWLLHALALVGSGYCDTDIGS